MRHLVSLTVLAALATACNNDDLPSVPATNNRPGVETRALELCVDGDATEGFASFVVKTAEGSAVAASNTTVSQFIDGERPGSGLWEGGQSLDSENLSSDLHVTLLLDASDSVVEAELFEQMKASAEQLLREGEADWAERPGNFSWQVIWFNQWVSAADEGWTFDDIADIPAPPPDFDGFTRLYSAMRFAVSNASQTRRDGVAAGDRDNHLLAVFTDGRDNISGRDSEDPPNMTGVTENEAPFSIFGTTATSRAELEELIRARPWLQVSLLGFGNNIDREALDGLAEAGGGTVFEGNDIERLFGRAEQSFEILQTVGWRLPFNPNEPHVWELDFKVKDISKATTIKLDVERVVDNNGKETLPECEEPKEQAPAK
ncbi:MAG: vWA domain-containing protein [Myxococcota bacterium]